MFFVLSKLQLKIDAKTRENKKVITYNKNSAPKRGGVIIIADHASAPISQQSDRWEKRKGDMHIYLPIGGVGLSVGSVIYFTAGKGRGAVSFMESLRYFGGQKWPEIRFET